MSIPASSVVSVIPGVLSPGGAGLVMNGLVLTQNPLMPTGTVLSFASTQSVSNFFGPSSAELAYASIYFAGMANGTQLPSAILFAPYNAAARAGWLTSGSLASVPLATLQGYTGTLTITFAGVPLTSTNIVLTALTQTAMAAAIEAAFTTPPFSVAWDAVRSMFVFTSTTTGATETITFASGSLAADLLLTQATGATLSQGAAQDTPATAMNNVVAVSQNWATFSYLTEPVLADKQGFAEWLSTQDDQYGGIIWDSDVLASTANATEPFGVIAQANKYTGIICIGGDPTLGALGPLTMNVAAFLQGMIASVNYSQTNGAINYSGKSANASVAVLPTCANLQTYQNLLANGYNCYGAFASRNEGLTFFSNSNAPGTFPWFDAYVDQIWLSAQLQLALLNLYTTVNDIDYDPSGYGMIRAALIGQPTANGSATNNGPINNALNAGVIVIGKTLSSTQALAVNSAAGANVAGIIQSNGYYLQILDPGATARNNRQTPIINLWYSGRSGIQQFSLSSIDIL